MALAVASVVALGACSHSRRIESGSAPTTPVTTSAIQATTSVVSAAARDDAVVAAYRAHWAAWYTAVQVADSNVPAIGATTTGDLLAHTRQELDAMRTSGERVKAEAGLTPIDSRQTRVVQFSSATSAVIVDCYIDNTIRYDAAGHAIGDTQPTFFSATATMVVEQGTWKVANLQLRKNGCRA